MPFLEFITRLCILYPVEEDGRRPTWHEVSSWFYTVDNWHILRRLKEVNGTCNRRARASPCEATPSVGSTDFVARAK